MTDEWPDEQPDQRSAEPTVEPATAWLTELPGVRRGESLARHTQYGIGGPADWFVELRSLEGLGELRRRCTASGIDITILGAGSNALVLDGGVRGLVIKLADKQLRVIDDGAVELSAGYMMPRAALDCARLGLTGLEFGIGIPGSCGASVWGNAGAFGGEIKDVLLDCDVIAPDGSESTLTGSQLGFSYRHSALKSELSGHIVVAARFAVHRDDAVAVKVRTDAIQARRKATQPYGIRSLGSTFKNPPGDAAGRLIEAAGLRGLRIGGAQIAPTHANFILNIDHACAADVLALMECAHAAVLEHCCVDLIPEIAVLGEPDAASAGVALQHSEPA